jgi:hypothetical protein
MALTGASEPVAGERTAQCERRANRGRACGRYRGSDAERYSGCPPTPTISPRKARALAGSGDPKILTWICTQSPPHALIRLRAAYQFAISLVTAR